MRLLFSNLFLLLSCFCSLAQNGVGIGTTSPNASAALDVASTTKGILVPRMNSGQRTGISSPAAGLLVFDITTESFWFRSSTAWVELVDTSNNLLKKSGNNLYTTGNTQVGIGISTPNYDLHIKQPNANIGLTDASTNKVSATITASDEDVIMNAYRSSDGGGNIILQRSSSIPALSAGNVGIGVPFPSAPMEKLQVNGNLRLQNTAAELVLHNGTAEKGNLYISGDDIRLSTSAGNTTGRLIFGTQAATRLVLSSTGELNRPSVTGNSNVLPLAFGRVNNGAVVNSTGNFSVQRVSDGYYKITLSGESNVYANRASYVVLVTPYNEAALTSRALLADVGIGNDNKVDVRLTRPKVNYLNDACANSCGPFSIITNIKFYDEADGEFSILIYKH